MLKRRDILKASLAGVGASFLPSIVGGAEARAQGTPPKSLVFILLRGGADPLTWLSPKGGTGQTTLAGFRPNLTLASPLTFSSTLYANQFMAPIVNDATLMSRFNVILHSGCAHETRSHFEQLDHVESGDSVSIASTGFLGRAATVLARPVASLGTTIPMSVRGTNPLCFTDPAQLQSNAQEHQFRFNVTRSQRLGLYRYSDANVDAIASIADAQISAAANAIGNVTASGLATAGGYLQADHGFGQRLATAAALVGSSWAPAIVTVDGDHDWDTHNDQFPNTVGEWYGMARKIDDVSRNIAKFKNDLVARGRWDSTAVIVMSEFGRCVKENTSGGTDHGRGGLMMLFGGAVRGHSDAAYVGPRSFTIPTTADSSTALSVVHDYRTVVAEVLERHMGMARATVLGLFPQTISAANYLNVIR